MANDHWMIGILGIVAVVAIVGMVIMFTGVSKIATSGEAKDIAGGASYFQEEGEYTIADRNYDFGTEEIVEILEKYNFDCKLADEEIEERIGSIGGVIQENKDRRELQEPGSAEYLRLSNNIEVLERIYDAMMETWKVFCLWGYADTGR